MAKRTEESQNKSKTKSHIEIVKEINTLDGNKYN